MPHAVIEDRDQFNAFLASQPLSQWVAQKQHEIAMGTRTTHSKSSAQAAPKDDNADLLAALSSMA